MCLSAIFFNVIFLFYYYMTQKLIHTGSFGPRFHPLEHFLILCTVWITHLLLDMIFFGGCGKKRVYWILKWWWNDMWIKMWEEWWEKQSGKNKSCRKKVMPHESTLASTLKKKKLMSSNEEPKCVTAISNKTLQGTSVGCCQIDNSMTLMLEEKHSSPFKLRVLCTAITLVKLTH